MGCDDAVEQGTAEGPVTPSETPPDPTRTKGKGGAPKGNKNASQANLYSGDPGLRRKGLKLAGKLFRTWLKELPKGLQENRQVRAALREMADLTVLRNRAFDYCLMRSPVDSKSGELRPVFQQLVELSDRLHKWRLEILTACGVEKVEPSDVKYIVSWPDGLGDARPGGRVPGAPIEKQGVPLPPDWHPLASAEADSHSQDEVNGKAPGSPSSRVLRQPGASTNPEKPKQPVNGDPLGLGWIPWTD
jgi:hypothetical protein